jgi:hypothetical protein
VKVLKNSKTRNLRKSVLASIVVNHPTRALEPLFYRETNRLLHSEITFESKEYS